MAKITFDMPPGPIKDYFDRFGKRAPGELKEGLKEAMMQFVKRFKAKRMTSHGSGSLGMRTGQLIKTLKQEVTGTILKNIQGRAHFSVPGKLKSVPFAHEHGAIIRPKNVDFLPVPLKAAMTASGVPRGTARAYIEGQVSVPKIDSTFFQETKKKNLLLFGFKKWAKGRGKGKNRKYGRLIPLFAMKKEVKIPGPKTGGRSRLGFTDEFRKFFGPAGRGIKIIAARWAKFIVGFGGKA